LPFHLQQLEFMMQLSNTRADWLNPFFLFLNYFDSVYFIFFLIPLVWFGISYHWGLRLFYWITFNFFINYSLKLLIHWPRPTQDLPEIGLFQPKSYGFPSFGAQTCMFLGLMLMYQLRTPVAWTIGVIYILLISFSRLYLGVHYPIDILGGWVIAIGLFTLFVFIENPLEKWLKSKKLSIHLTLSVVIPLSVSLIAKNQEFSSIMQSVMGVGIGTYFSLKHHLFLKDPKNKKEAALRVLIGLVTIALVAIVWPFQVFLKLFVVGFFMSFAVSPICKKLLFRSP
jgi:membrane-associated phospholipid phosphatase